FRTGSELEKGDRPAGPDPCQAFKNRTCPLFLAPLSSSKLVSRCVVRDTKIDSAARSGGDWAAVDPSRKLPANGGDCVRVIRGRHQLRAAPAARWLPRMLRERRWLGRTP